MKIVMKFGGTSVANGRRIKNVAKLVDKLADGNSIVVVCSALDDVTDELLALTEDARNGNEKVVQQRLKALKERHAAALKDAVRSPAARAKAQRSIGETFGQLEKLSLGSTILKELTPRSRDSMLSAGERLSNPIVAAALAERGRDATYMTGGDAGIMTDGRFGDAAPLMEVSGYQVRETLGPLLDAGKIPVVTGYIGVTQDGELTTFGRGGSDLSATVIASAIDADEVWIWSDVDGLMTADPRTVKEAQVLSEVSYAEAGEMAVFGAKALHPRTLEPVAEKQIPVRFKNTFNPDYPGTMVVRTPAAYADKVVKCVALVNDVAIITLTGASMVGRPGSAARIFDTVAKSGTNVLMISQSVSESNISMVVGRRSMQRAVNALELSMMGQGGLKGVNYEDDVSAIAVVGGGMKGAKGIAAKVFSAIAARGINVRMIAQGSSEQNISFVVREGDGKEAVRAVHSAFRLERINSR
ncbi:MAG: aspartate kinase [Thaumarchaeota archaeon]|nr:aspartate kinase [Nitrososphaerota archaeon]